MSSGPSNLSLPLPVVQPLEASVAPLPAPIQKSDLNITVKTPSRVVSCPQVVQIIWKGFKFFLDLVLWITQLSRVRDYFFPKFQMALYEDIVLSPCHRHLVGAKTSVVLNYLHQFFKREKDTPPELLAQLKQAAQWSKKVEAAETSWTHGNRQKHLLALSSEISRAIEKLKAGESTLVPGGIIAGEAIPPVGNHYTLYRVTREGDTYRFEIWSRDPSLGEEVTLLKKGKEKVLSATSFHSLTKEEISNRSFWHALLSLQMDKLLDDATEPMRFACFANPLINMAGPLAKQLLPQQMGGSSPEVSPPFEKLFAPFQDRQVDPSSYGPESYHVKRRLCRVQNLWSMLYDKENGSEKVSRRKLRLSLETLYRYFEATHSDL
ncbi:MAG: hypothetical protein KGJ02_05640, partial [Verrucomicrobiota bacterium]|nr:hypothetical protein [Verrucomicrobiota bacterium]